METSAKQHSSEDGKTLGKKPALRLTLSRSNESHRNAAEKPSISLRHKAVAQSAMAPSTSKTVHKPEVKFASYVDRLSRREELDEIKGKIHQTIQDFDMLFDTTHLESDHFATEILSYAASISSHEIQHKLRRVVESYRFLLKQLTQLMGARELLLSDLADWFLQKDLPDFWFLVEPEADDKRALFMKAVADTKMNFDKFVRFKREIDALEFRGENVDVMREQKRGIEESIMMLLHKLRELQPAAMPKDFTGLAQFTEAQQNGSTTESTWQATVENVRRLLSQLEPSDGVIVKRIEESMEELSSNMVSQTVKLKETSGKLMELKSMEDHWKEENFSLAADKATLEDKLRNLEMQITSIVEMQNTPLLSSMTTIGEKDGAQGYVLPIDGQMKKGNTLLAREEVEFLRSQVKLLKKENWTLQKQRDSLQHEVNLMQEKCVHTEDKMMQIQLIVRQLETALTIKSSVELEAMKRDRINLRELEKKAANKWTNEDIEEILRRYADKAVKPTCPNCKFVFEWAINNEFIATLHELVLRQQSLLDKLIAELPPDYDLHLHMSDTSLQRTIELMRKHREESHGDEVGEGNKI